MIALLMRPDEFVCIRCEPVDSGAFCANPELHPAIRKVMKAAWGEWVGSGKHLQLHFHPRLADDGWGEYAMRNHRKLEKLIGTRTFTTSQPLRRDAKWAYNEIRGIMRSRLFTGDG